MPNINAPHHTSLTEAKPKLNVVFNRLGSFTCELREKKSRICSHNQLPPILFTLCCSVEKKFKILKANLGSSERIINDFEKFKDIKKTKIVKFDISFHLSKIFFKRIILWIYAFFKIYKIVPNSLLKGKFVILRENYAMNHLKHFQ